MNNACALVETASDPEKSDAFVVPKSFTRLPGQTRYGFFMTRNNARPDVIADGADVNSAFTPLWDTWFNEKVTYDPTTGVMEYFINDVSQGTYNVGGLPQTNSPTMTLTFTAWGWYTGHEHLMQNLVVTQVQ